MTKVLWRFSRRNRNRWEQKFVNLIFRFVSFVLPEHRICQLLKHLTILFFFLSLAFRLRVLSNVFSMRNYLIKSYLNCSFRIHVTSLFLSSYSHLEILKPSRKKIWFLLSSFRLRFHLERTDNHISFHDDPFSPWMLIHTHE